MAVDWLRFSNARLATKQIIFVNFKLIDMLSIFFYIMLL